MTDDWSGTMVRAIENLTKNFAANQGVYIRVKLKWKKCESTKTGGLPFTTHLDWVEDEDYFTSEQGGRGEDFPGFDVKDKKGIHEAIPEAIKMAVEAALKK